MLCNWRNGRQGCQVKQGVGRALEEEEEPRQRPEEIWSLWRKQKTVFNMNIQGYLGQGPHSPEAFFFFL